MIRLGVAVLAACVMTGCASAPHTMAIDRSADSIDTSVTSVMLFTIEIPASPGSRFVPLPTAVRIAQAGDDDAETWPLSADDATVTPDGKTLYLARIALTPGDYEIQGVDGVLHAAPVTGVFALPLNLPFTAAPRSVIYLGRITGTLRARKESEFRAGPLEPAEAQHASGLADSTWDVMTEAQTKQDVAALRSNFHVLKVSKLLVRPLPAFDRERAEKAWDDEHPDDK